MPDEKYYEQRLTNAIVALQREQQSASAFLTAAQKRNSLISSICGRIAGLVGISATDADSYINYTYGTFKGGKYMPHCLDSQLKQMFAQLEQVTAVINKYNYHTMSEAETAVMAKLAVMKNEVNEIKRIYGEDRYKQIVTRAKAAAIKITGISF